MGIVCNRCKNYNLGKCEIYGVNTYEIKDRDIKDNLYDCFKERILHIDLGNEGYSDPMSEECKMLEILRITDCDLADDIVALFNKDEYLSLEELQEYEYSLEPEANEDSRYNYYTEGTYKMGQNTGEKDRYKELWEIHNKNKEYKNIDYISSNYGGEMVEVVKSIKNIKI